eukprot:COSAG05_NODE_14839_length_385_cov_1.370629_1_plen_33_part_10
MCIYEVMPTYKRGDTERGDVVAGLDLGYQWWWT